MFKSYFKIAVRSLWKHKLFSFINIFGLAVGMAISILALIDLKQSYDYDLFHPYPERTYRIITDVNAKTDKQQSWASTPSQVGDALRKYSFTEACVQIYSRLLNLSAGGEFLRNEVNFVDPGFFKLFGFEMLRGQYVNTPYTIVLNEELAKSYFGKSDPIGKTLKDKSGSVYTVTGILAMVQGKTHLEYRALVPASTLPLLRSTQPDIERWNETACLTYVLLKPGVPGTVFKKVLPGIGRQATKSLTVTSYKPTMGFRSQTLGEITPDREDLLIVAGAGQGMSMNKVMIQLAVGVLTLLLAGFNYVNLTLARSLARSREVGVRKVIGARKGQLFMQFVTESVILAGCALLLSIGMLQLMKSLTVVSNILLDVKWDIKLISILGGFTLMAGFLAGVIPAKLLSAFNPVTALKGQSRPLIFSGLTLRKILVVVQFTISLTGIVFMLVMYQQRVWMADGEFGFNRENILNIELGDHNARLVAAEVMKQPGVEQVVCISDVPGLSRGREEKIATLDQQFDVHANVLSADAGLVPMMGLKLIAGQNLDASASDSAGNSVLLNETALQGLQFTNAQAAVGTTIRLSDSLLVQVAGIVKDFRTSGMARAVNPLLIRYEPKKFKALQVKVISTGSQATTRANISQGISKMIRPAQQNITWFDEELHDAYFHAEDQLFLGILTGMILSIACLGLLGMVTYTSEIRTKEVGIRKVMGASVGQVVILLSGDFVRLLGIAALLAFPAGLISGTLFLNSFTYHTSIGPGTVLAGFLSLLVIGGLTIGWQTFRTAGANPVASLRTE